MESPRADASPDRRTARRKSGDGAEQAVVDHLVRLGWTIVARNVRVGRSEVDIIAREPSGSLVFVEVRSRSGTRLGMPEESVDAAKVARLYAAAWELLRIGRSPGGESLTEVAFRVDLVTVVRADGAWLLRGHLRGLAPP
jgi:putative endonuclease